MKWDGITRPRAEWNRDQTLKSALEFSTLWYFQRLATQLGLERERQWLAKLAYGNARVDGDVTTFWLGQSLRISADEQADFLRRLWTDALPFSPRNMQIVRDLLPGQRGPHGEIHAKTGSGRGTCWYVGHVTHDGAGYVFATRISDPSCDRVAAIALTERMLRERGLWVE
jgi:beta-lactamase class D